VAAHPTQPAPLAGWQPGAGRPLVAAPRPDRHFGFSTPYVMAIHQAPTDGADWPDAHLRAACTLA
jgi:hypothetical protein